MSIFATSLAPSDMLDDINKAYWATADKLRANMDAAEYKHLVLDLIFVKYIPDTFIAPAFELIAHLLNHARMTPAQYRDTEMTAALGVAESSLQKA